VTSGLTTAAMLAVMLLHAVFGCCWHHTHASCAAPEVAGRGMPAEAGCRHDRCPGHHHGHDGHGHENDRHDGEPAGHDEDQAPAGGPHDCCGEDCLFLTASKTVPPTDVAGSRHVTELNRETPVAAAFLELQSLARSGDPPADAGPALRRLTQLCVWRL
jgi:hypothetical protein